MEEYILEIFNSKEELCAKYKIDNIKIFRLNDEGAKTKLALIKTKNSNLKFMYLYNLIVIHPYRTKLRIEFSEFGVII